MSSGFIGQGVSSSLTPGAFVKVRWPYGNYDCGTFDAKVISFDATLKTVDVRYLGPEVEYDLGLPMSCIELYSTVPKSASVREKGASCGVCEWAQGVDIVTCDGCGTKAHVKCYNFMKHQNYDFCQRCYSGVMEFVAVRRVTIAAAVALRTSAPVRRRHDSSGSPSGSGSAEPPPGGHCDAWACAFCPKTGASSSPYIAVDSSSFGGQKSRVGERDGASTGRSEGGPSLWVHVVCALALKPHLAVSNASKGSFKELDFVRLTDPSAMLSIKKFACRRCKICSRSDARPSGFVVQCSARHGWSCPRVSEVVDVLDAVKPGAKPSSSAAKAGSKLPSNIHEANFAGCESAAHVLCARNSGWMTYVRPGKKTFWVLCAAHTRACMAIVCSQRGDDISDEHRKAVLESLGPNGGGASGGSERLEQPSDIFYTLFSNETPSDTETPLSAIEAARLEAVAAAEREAADLAALSADKGHIDGWAFHPPVPSALSDAEIASFVRPTQAALTAHAELAELARVTSRDAASWTILREIPMSVLRAEGINWLDHAWIAAGDCDEYEKSLTARNAVVADEDEM